MCLCKPLVLTDQKLPSPPHTRFLQELEVASADNHHLACNPELMTGRELENIKRSKCNVIKPSVHRLFINKLPIGQISINYLTSSSYIYSNVTEVF